MTFPINVDCRGFQISLCLGMFLSLGRVSSSGRDAVWQLAEAAKRGLNVEGRQEKPITEFPKSFNYGLVTNIESAINRGCQGLLHLRRVEDYRKTLKPNEGVGEFHSRVLGMSGFRTDVTTTYTCLSYVDSQPLAFRNKLEGNGVTEDLCHRNGSWLSGKE